MRISSCIDSVVLRVVGGQKLKPDDSLQQVPERNEENSKESTRPNLHPGLCPETAGPLDFRQVVYAPESVPKRDPDYPPKKESVSEAKRRGRERSRLNHIVVITAGHLRLGNQALVSGTLYDLVREPVERSNELMMAGGHKNSEQSEGGNKRAAEQDVLELDIKLHSKAGNQEPEQNYDSRDQKYRCVVPIVLSQNRRKTGEELIVDPDQCKIWLQSERRDDRTQKPGKIPLPDGPSRKCRSEPDCRMENPALPDIIAAGSWHGRREHRGAKVEWYSSNSDQKESEADIGPRKVGRVSNGEKSDPSERVEPYRHEIVDEGLVWRNFSNEAGRIAGENTFFV